LEALILAAFCTVNVYIVIIWLNPVLLFMQYCTDICRETRWRKSYKQSI